MWLERCNKNKLLKEISTFGIGGPARWFLEVNTVELLQEAICQADQAKIPYLIVGKGSNTLFDDRGFNGLVLLNKISFMQEEENLIHVSSGYSFSLLGAQTAKKGWSGLEFASGIPATVGGAVYMNAGAGGHETCDHLLRVTYMTTTGDMVTYNKEELQFSYRFSSFQTMKGAIVIATFELLRNQEARNQQLAMIDYRTRTQPYGDKSAGCVFRNPKAASAGALIEQCGLKGLKVGDAEVSTLHANFIVNKGCATARDVLELARLVQNKVHEATGVELEMEIRCQPYENT
ncbi:MAG: UDP-N-acetylmuramate dehydrogenase [Simkania sp.]|nr:UDP-N-acetylmuramate dehydrogenase [Simkania sp.]